MKALPYRISKKAVADLDEIWHYTARKWSVAQTDRYYSLIFDEINHICQNPTSGKDINNIRRSYLSSKVKSHLIFYRVINQTVK